MPGFPEWVFLAFLALLIFGPKRLPEMARTAGRLLARVKAEAASTMDELKRAADTEGLREVASELRQTQIDFQRTTRELTAPQSMEAAAGSGPAPFDPDAT